MAAAISAAACSSSVYPALSGRDWKNVDDAGIPLSKGAAECKYQAITSAKSATGLSKQGEVATDLYDSCMRQRGY